MKWVVYNNKNIEKYVTFIDSIKYSGIWHYPEWLKFQLEYGRAINGFFFGIEQNDNIILAGLYLIQKSSLNINYAYIPAGILYNSINKEIYDFFVKNIFDLAKQYNILFTQIDSITPFNENYDQILHKYKNHKLNINLPIPSYTTQIDLTLSEEEILKKMKHKGRYNINLALKKGVKIIEKNKDDISIFYNLLLETCKRDKFRPNPENYYKKMIENIPNIKYLIAIHENDILAAGIFTYTKNQALYYYGASANIKRNLMAPYLLQWEAIKIGKLKNCLYYDFLGIANPANKKDKLLSVTDFKLKFSDNIVRFQSSYLIIHKKINYYIYNLLKNIKRFFK